LFDFKTKPKVVIKTLDLETKITTILISELLSIRTIELKGSKPI
jgi:hypothetical protein